MSGRALTIKTLVLASGRALGALAALALTAVLTRALSVEQYATHKQALLLYAMASPLLMLGLPKALYYFLPGEPRRAPAALTENLILLLLGGAMLGVAILAGLGELAARRFDNPALLDAARWIAPYGLAMAPLAALGACLVARDRVGPLVRFNLGSRVLLVGVVAASALVWGTAEATVAAHAAWAVVMVVPAIWMMRRAVMPSAQSGDGIEAIRRPSWSGMASQLRFAVPLGLASLLGTLSAQLDKLIVSSMCSTEDFAIYATGAIELPLIGVVTGAMSAVVLPELTRAHKAGAPERIVDLWQAAMKTALLILAPVMFAVLLTGPELMAVLFSSTYTEAAGPLRIYALLLPLRAAVYGSVLMATDNTRWVTASAAVGLGLNGILSVIGVWLMGYPGAAWATVLTTYGVVAFMLWPMSRALRCRARDLVPWRHVAVVLAVSGGPALLVGGIGWLTRDVISHWHDAMRLVVLGGTYGGLVALAYQLSGVTTLRRLLAFVRRADQRSAR